MAADFSSFADIQTAYGSDDYTALNFVLISRQKFNACVVHAPEGTELVVMAVPLNAVGPARLRPRAGPLYRASNATVGLPTVGDGTPKSIQVQLVVASTAILGALNLYDPDDMDSKPFDEVGQQWPTASSLLRGLGRAFPGLAVKDGGADDAGEEFATGEDVAGGAQLPFANGDDHAAPGEVQYPEDWYDGAWGAGGEDYTETFDMARADHEGYDEHELQEAAAAASNASRAAAKAKAQPTPPAPARAPALRRAPARATSPPAHLYPGLAADVVNSALGSGIAPEELKRFESLVMRGRGRGRSSAPAAAPCGAPPGGRGALPARGGARGGRAGPTAQREGPGDAAVDPINRMASAITEAFETLQTRRHPEGRDALDRALFAGSGAHGYGFGGGGEGRLGNRHGAAGMQAMRSILLEHPEFISEHVDRRLRDAFRSRSVAGNDPLMREYLEHRSRMNNHPPSINWMWAVAGARDALRSERPQEALARLDLLLLAGEQVSIDRGSWLVAREMLFEDDPPYHAFEVTRPQDPLRAAHPFLADPRWIEICMARLRELDDWADRRRRLATRSSYATPQDATATTTGGAEDEGETEGQPQRARGRGRGKGRN